MASLGTGYLYNWGVGFSGENSIPNELTGSIASGFIGVGNTFNAVQIIDPPIVLGPPANTPLRKSYGKFGFAFYNSDSSISPLHKLEIFSSFSGTGSGAFLSGNDFIGKIVMTTNAGDTGIKNNRAFVSLGKTLGTGSGIYTYPQDTFISINKNNFRYKEYDTWSGDYSLFIQNQFSGYYDSSVNKFKIFSGNDGGAVIKDLGGTNGVLNNLHLYEIQYGTLEPIQSGKLVRQKILFQNLNTEYPKYEQVQTIDNKAWASYNTSTGLLNNTQNVFAYAFQFIDVATTRDSGIVITSGTQQNPFEYLQKLEVPTITSGFDTSFTNYIGYCFSRSTCPEPNLPAEDIQECFTGNSVTGNEYKEFVSGVLKKYASQEYQNEADAASNIVISSGVTISNLFTYQTGQIYFNNFITGDKIKFNLYNFDYTGDYKNYHLNNNPIYPSLDFTLSYPQDFSNIDQLVAKLNQNLYNINPWVWYPYECLSGQATGIYISGKLMSFEKLTGSGFTIGNKNYNNVISYRSLRNYKRGFNLKFDLINREEYVEDLYQQVFRKGFSYLVPNVVELQGLSGTDWIVLDRRSGLYDSLTGLKPTKIPIDVDPNLFLSTGEPFLNSNQLEENILPSETGIEEILFSGGFQTLQRFKQTTYNSAPPYCNVRTDVRNINIVQATGWPVGYDPCGKNKDQGEKEEPPSGQGQAGEDQKLELFLNVKRTGWLLEPTGIYLSCITGPDYNPSKIQFSGYRVVMRNFSGLSPYGENLYLKPRNEIYISNINFWSLEPTGIPVHTGKSQCLIGSKYQVDVADIVAVPFNYDFNYTITGENQKGLFTAYNYPIIYPYKAFYPTGAISDNNKTVIGGASTGYFALSGLGGNTLLLSSGSRLSIYVAGYPTESNWATGKSVTWLASANNIIYSGFQLYYNNTGYFSGTATGNGGLGQVTYTGYLPPDAKYLRCAQLSTGSQNIKINYTGWSGYYDFAQVKFVRESGKLVDNLTGLINGSFAGSGLIKHTFGNYYFYNPSASKVYFREDLSGNFYRSGILTGQFNVIKDYVINQELFLGGRLYAVPEYYEKIANGYITGFLTGIKYFKPDVEGLYYLTGQITGLSKSGYYKYSGVYVTGSGVYINENNFPYYPVYTGVTQSEGTVIIDFNKIKNFDKFNLNNTTITYNTEIATFFPPDYFSNIDNLIETINTNVNIFYATGEKLSSSGIKIRALEYFAPGINGNSIIITGNGSGFTFSSSTLTGGKTFYPRLYPTTLFSGYVDGSIASTGFYSQLGSGSITGNVQTFTGVRTFTGIWDFKTGSNYSLKSFLGNNWISGNSAYINSGLFLNNYNNLKLHALYNNQLDTFDSEPLDVGQITVYDKNYNLLLNPPSGETNPYIFRITGIKNI